MRSISILLFIATTMLGGCVSMKPESDIAVRGLLSNSYWFTTTKGCKVAHDNMVDNATYDWSGGCQNGLVSGCGRLVKRDRNDNVEWMNGCFTEGKKNGRFTVTYTLLPGKTHFITYSMGQVTEFDDKPPSPPPPVRQLPDDPKTIGRSSRGR